MKASEAIDKETAALALRAERRRNRRYPCNILSEAVARYRGSIFRGKIVDISGSGCFLLTKAFLDLERYTEVDLSFKYKNVDYRTVALVMDIQLRRGVGFEFSFADAQTAQVFLALSEEVSAATASARG
jgi:hypothetical protein